MRKIITIGLLAAILVGCYTPPARTAYTPTPKKDSAHDVVRQSFQLTSEQEQKAKDSVLGKLKDPESARFSSISGVGDPGGTGQYSVCGNVNAKNGYGGYTGPKPFAVAAGYVLIWDDSGNRFASNDNEMIKILCTSNR